MVNPGATTESNGMECVVSSYRSLWQKPNGKYNLRKSDSI